MGETPKTYKEEILPLWREEIKQAFGWTNPINALLRTGGLIAGLWFALSLTGNLDDFIGSLLVEIGKIFFTVAVFLFILMYTYVRASQKLYDNQVEKRRKLGEFTENPFRVEIYKQDRQGHRERPLRHSLEINNTMSSKQIKDCYVSLDYVFDTKTTKQPERIQKNLMWNADVGEENQCKLLNISGGGRLVCDVVKEETSTTVYYLTWNSEKIRKSITPGEYILSFTVFGDLDNVSKPYHYHCAMLVENNYKTSLKDVREGVYKP
jgi:hypothetical protein